MRVYSTATYRFPLSFVPTYQILMNAKICVKSPILIQINEVQSMASQPHRCIISNMLVHLHTSKGLMIFFPRQTGNRIFTKLKNKLLKVCLQQRKRTKPEIKLGC